ncbi:AAA family ATPase [Agrobacterium salinitolerans]|nr:AAA family ATPase [Agrobacterium salinitolerans]
MNNTSGHRQSEQESPEIAKELMSQLRSAWDYAEDEPIMVIGQLSRTETATGNHLLFLRDIEHPKSGKKLVFPGSNETDIKVMGGHRITHECLAMAVLELSPKKIREDKKTPHLCCTQAQTLRLFDEIPKDWVVDLDGSPIRDVSRITSRAGEIIKKRLAAIEAIEIDKINALADKRKALEHEVSALADIKEQNETELAALKELVSQSNIDAKAKARMVLELVRTKADRLVALGLVDEADIARTLPMIVEHDRTSPEFEEILGGDVKLLAPYLQKRLSQQGLMFRLAQLRDFLALVLTNDIVVFAGDSGSGKTSMVKAVASALGGECHVIPVRPNWTGPEDLLGYFNPVSRTYQSTPFLQALQVAEQDPARIHFICLDEMNIAHVEHYFADFLSSLEERNAPPTIQLHSSDEESHVVVESDLFLRIDEKARHEARLPATATIGDMLENVTATSVMTASGGFESTDSLLSHHGNVRRSLVALLRTPPKMALPTNVRIVGAMNVDETTNYLSPKVLDRVHVVRFENPVLQDWDALQDEIDAVGLDCNSNIHVTPGDLGERRPYPEFNRNDPVARFLLDLSKNYLDILGIEFGMRAIRQSMAYVNCAKMIGISQNEALDNVIGHKVLPKISMEIESTVADGRTRKKVLEAMGQFLQVAFEAEKASCVDDVRRLIAGSERNNGIANYWIR